MPYPYEITGMDFASLPIMLTESSLAQEKREHNF